jgi:hypothetical protein
LRSYKVPLKTNNDDITLSNNRALIDNLDLVTSEFKSLLNTGCIKGVQVTPVVVNPLTIAYNKSSKPRLVLDFRHINPHLFEYRFKYEDIKVARNIFQEGDYSFSYDLKSTYHHIEMFINISNISVSRGVLLEY